MEDKGNFWSKLFKRKKPQEAPSSSLEQPLSAGVQEREARLKERQKQRKQETFSHTVEQAQSGLKITAPPGTGPLDLEKGKQETAVGQSIEKGAELREKFASKGTPGERFGRLTQSETKKDTSSPEQVVEKKTPETAAKPVGETLSERKTQEIDRESLSKSITKPTWPKEKAPEKAPETAAKPVGETLPERKTQEIDRERLSKSITKPTWPKEKPQKKTLIEQKVSVPPFKPGTFPGVEKWQPGKGAISVDEAKKIREKLKTEPAYSPEKPKEQS